LDTRQSYDRLKAPLAVIAMAILAPSLLLIAAILLLTSLPRPDVNPVHVRNVPAHTVAVVTPSSPGVVEPHGRAVPPPPVGAFDSTWEGTALEAVARNATLPMALDFQVLDDALRRIVVSSSAAVAVPNEPLPEPAAQVAPAQPLGEDVRLRGPSSGHASLNAMSRQAGAERVARAMHDAEDGMNVCYQASTTRNPDVDGRIEVEWAVTHGHADAIQVVENTTGDSELAQCIADRVEAMAFPSGVRGTFSWPFVFRGN
jgi:hypothetical protein